MDCENIRENLAAFIDGELEEEEVAKVESHLESCRECRREFEGLRRTARAMEEFLEPRAMRESVVDAVMSNVAAGKGAAKEPFLMRLGWAFTGAVAAVLVLLVFGLVGSDSGRPAIAEEVVDEALADHSRTFELVKKQIINSAVRDPEEAVGIFRMEIKISGLEEKTRRLGEILEACRHSRKEEIERYVASVHEFLDFIKEPPLRDMGVTREALEKKAAEIWPIEENFEKSGDAQQYKISFEIPAELDDTSRKFFLAKRDLYSGNFGHAAKVFSMVAQQVPENPIAEDARYWKVYAELQGGMGEIEINGDFNIPHHGPFRREIRKDIMKWVEKGRHSMDMDPGRLENIVEMIGKIGISVETEADEEGNRILKIQRKDGNGNTATSVIKIKAEIPADTGEREESEDK